MPFNGTGIFEPIAYPDYPAVAGTTIRAAQFNANMLDLFSGLSNCLTKDGQTLPTEDLPMAAHKHTNVARAANANEYARYDQVLIKVNDEPWFTGDFSNANPALRDAFKTNVADGNTHIGANPDGTGNSTSFRAYNAEAVANAGYAELAITNTEATLRASRLGAGTYLPFNIEVNGVTRFGMPLNGLNTLGGKLALANAAVVAGNNFEVSDTGTVDLLYEAGSSLTQTMTAVTDITHTITAGGDYLESIAATSTASRAVVSDVSVEYVLTAGTAGSEKSLTLLQGLLASSLSTDTPFTLTSNLVTVAAVNGATINDLTVLGRDISCSVTDTHTSINDSLRVASASQPFTPLSTPAIDFNFGEDPELGGAANPPIGLPLALASQRIDIASWRAHGVDTTSSAMGMIAPTTAGAGGLIARAVAFSATSLLPSRRRLGIRSGAALNNGAGHYMTVAAYLTAWPAHKEHGGFRYTCRFGIPGFAGVNSFGFVGLSASVALFGTADPATFVNVLGVKISNDGSGNPKLEILASGSVAQAVRGTYISPAAVGGNFYELCIESSPQSPVGRCTITVRDLSTKDLVMAGHAHTEIVTDGTQTAATFPAHTVPLAHRAYMINGHAAAIDIDIASVVFETAFSYDAF